jgi:hypothetical protein
VTDNKEFEMVYKLEVIIRVKNENDLDRQIEDIEQSGSNFVRVGAYEMVADSDHENEYLGVLDIGPMEVRDIS